MKMSQNKPVAILRTPKSSDKTIIEDAKKILEENGYAVVIIYDEMYIEVLPSYA